MANNNLVLLGAGFSCNWGAPLAAEVAAWLLGKVEVSGDPYLQGLLTHPGQNFENALSQIQKEFISSPSARAPKSRLDKLQSAIVAMFGELNAALPPAFEFSEEKWFSVTEFLVRFDAIFGLNQDLLLEMRYEQNVHLADARKWDGLQKPGMIPRHDNSQMNSGTTSELRWTPALPPYAVGRRLQPYFKMHGSSNWYTNDGRDLLVMGCEKELLIEQSPILSWYYGQFRHHLFQPDTRLMVIGYSFADGHINSAITEAWKYGSLKGMFLVNPSGRRVLTHANPTFTVCAQWA